MKRIIYHNEIFVKVDRAVKRRFMEICRERGRRPDELGGDVIKDYVITNTPRTAAKKITNTINNWMDKNTRGLYLLFTSICFLMIGMITIIIMQQQQDIVYRVTILFGLVIMLLLFAKIFFMFGRREK